MTYKETQEEVMKEFEALVEKLGHKPFYLEPEIETRTLFLSAMQRSALAVIEEMRGRIPTNEQVCDLCGCSPTEPPHYLENSVWFCPHDHHKCNKNSTAPCINISGTDETKGFNDCLSTITTTLNEIENKLTGNKPTTKGGE